MRSLGWVLIDTETDKPKRPRTQRPGGGNCYNPPRIYVRKAEADKQTEGGRYVVTEVFRE